jgi:hypothetical protein
MRKRKTPQRRRFGRASERKPTIYEALKQKLGREPTHAELKADVKRILHRSDCGNGATWEATPSEEAVKRRRAIRRRRAYAGGPRQTRYWAHLVGFSKPIPIWASTLTEAYGKAGAAAIASGVKVTLVTLTERGGS